jgi:hypothetical protein
METFERDLEHLKLLSIFYYINAGLSAVFACMPLIHVTMGIFIAFGGFDQGKHPPPAFVGWLFIVFGSVLIMIGWTLAVTSFLTAKYLKQQKNYLFCLIVAGLNCAFFPMGTILGVFTFIVLFRESVKKLFNGASPGEFS